jgi:hypothetical protein
MHKKPNETRDPVEVYFRTVAAIFPIADQKKLRLSSLDIDRAVVKIMNKRNFTEKEILYALKQSPVRNAVGRSYEQTVLSKSDDIESPTAKNFEQIISALSPQASKYSPSITSFSVPQG